MHHYQTNITNVLVIGSGGAGLRAAIEAKLSGLSVYVLGKRSKHDPHTVLAAGGINASYGNIDKDDCWEQHFADTYLEGYKIGNPKLIETMAKEAPGAVLEIDSWGANFAKLKNGNLDQRFFGAHTYRRTCYSGDYTGLSIQNTLLNKTRELNIKIFDSEYVTDLLVEEEKCFGAVSFNIQNGEKTVHLADSIILCTGGHTKNWKRSSSRKNENNGDGMHLGLKAGCKLIDMEMVQFHPTGMIFPEDYEGTLVTEAVRGEGGKLINGIGERFMINYDKTRMELSTRDKVTIANYTEIIEGRCTKNGGVFLDISHKEKDFILKKIPKIYRQFIEAQSLDITKSPMEVAPTAHYSMGGIDINSVDHSTNIEGLFAAGEVAGGLHGANRLGGNSLAEILVFGKIAGFKAAKYSKDLKVQKRSLNIIKKSLNGIDNKIRSGKELVIPLQRELSLIMWKYCGVVKNSETLNTGLEKIKEIKLMAKEAEVRVDDRNFQDLVNILNLDSSIITGEATILSALHRKESRGAHQRSDYKNTSFGQNVNYKISLNNEELEIEKSKLHKLNSGLSNVVSSIKKIDDFKNKLLE